MLCVSREPELDNSPFFRACLDGDLNTVQTLLSEGNHTAVESDSNSRAPIHYALIGGHKPVIDHLLSVGASLAQTGHDACPSIFYAALGGYNEGIKRCMYVGNEYVPSVTGRSILHCLIDGGQLALYKSLLPCVNDAPDRNKLFMYALGCGQLDFVQYFVSCGTKLSHVDEDGYTVFELACFSGCLAVVEWVWQRHNFLHDRALFFASVNGSPELGEFLLAIGVQLEGRDEHGFTPLMNAVYVANIPLAKYLISKGASLHAISDMQCDCIGIAVHRGNVEVVEFVLSVQPELEMSHTVRCDFLPLVAARQGHFDVMILLFEKGFLADTTEAGIEELVRIVAATYTYDALKYVLEKFIIGPIHPTWLTDYGLCTCARYGKIDCIQLLASYGHVKHGTWANAQATAQAFGQTGVVEHINQIKHWTPLEVTINSNMVGRIKSLLVAGVELGSIQRLRSIPCDPITKILVRDATLPWSPRTHQLFPREYQVMVHNLILSNNRQSIMPAEMLFAIIAFIDRNMGGNVHT